MNRLFVLYLKPSLCQRTGLADVGDTEMPRLLVLAQAVWGNLGADVPGQGMSSPNAPRSQWEGCSCYSIHISC